MNQVDWVHDPLLQPAKAPQKVFRDTREAIASRKAELMLVLKPLLLPPQWIREGGTVDQVRHWMSELTAVKAIASKSRCSVNDVEIRIKRMRAAAKRPFTGNGDCS